jgi:hypothetical protein
MDNTPVMRGGGMAPLVAEKDVATIEASPVVTPTTSASDIGHHQDEERRVRRKIDAVVLPTVSIIARKFVP